MKPDGHLGQLVLDLLKVDQRLLKTRPGLRITYRGLVSGLGNTDALSRYVDPPSIVGLHANVEPVTLLTDKIVGRYFDMVKNQFRRLRASEACRFDVTSYLESLCSSFNNECTQTLMPLLATWRRTRSSEHQVEVRDLTVCDERLPAVDLPVASVKLGR